ncbi:hypothetical protein [Streptomyces sp. NPDC002769]|uniref:hypothetical protein n=1 Tax=Streptomyces sp. NPDC002769 TaxID=3154542 RepID=UPI00331CA950
MPVRTRVRLPHVVRLAIGLAVQGLLGTRVRLPHVVRLAIGLAVRVLLGAPVRLPVRTRVLPAVRDFVLRIPGLPVRISGFSPRRGRVRRHDRHQNAHMDE